MNHNHPGQDFHLPPQALQNSLSQVISAVRSNELLAPLAIERYETLEELAKGGMGAVYRVRDKRFQREAALKLIRSENPDPRELQRFIRESRITAMLDHPAIPPVYDGGINMFGQHFLVLRLIEGQTLYEFIEDYHKAPQNEGLRQFLESLIRVCEALSFAHSRRIVHRDLKPENVMIGAFGEVMVLDWGIARDMSEDVATDHAFMSSQAEAQPTRIDREGLTQQGFVVGTLGYMSPEQAQGESVGPEADIFALGGILYAFLTQALPFPGDTEEERYEKTVRGDIVPPRVIDRTADAELSAMAMKALAFHPSDRYQTPEEFLLDLRAYLNDQKVQAYSYSILESAKRSARRYPWVFMSFAALFIVLSLGYSLWLQQERALQGWQKAEQAAVTVQQNATAQQAEFDAQRRQSELEKRLKEKSSYELRQLENFLAYRFQPFRSLEDEGRLQKETRRIIEQRLKTLSQSIEENPKFLDLYIARSRAYLNLYRYEKALADIETVLKTKQDLGDAWLLKSQILTRQLSPLWLLSSLDQEEKKRLTQLAIFSFSQAKKHKAKIPAIVKAWEAMTRADYDEALLSVTGARQGPRWDEALYLEAMARGLKSGDLKVFQEKLGELLNQSPRFLPALFIQGILTINEGKTAEAELLFKRGILVNPRSFLCYEAMGTIYSKSQPKSAIPYFTKALEINPKRSSSYFNRALCHYRLGQFSTAILDYSEAIQTRPNYARAMINRAVCFRSLGKKKEAIADFQKALQINPKHPKRARFEAIIRELQSQ